MHDRVKKTPALVLAAALLLAAPVRAAVQDLAFGSMLPKASLLREGSHHYLRYMISGETRAPIDIITREIRFTTSGNEKLMHIRQRYDGALTPPSAPSGAAGTGAPAANTPSLKVVDSWFDAGTFRPRTHQRVTDKDGKRVVEGFVFGPDKITGMPDLPDNTRKDFAVDSAAPAYNFETDMEMLQALPLAEGYEARIVFYHPGGAAAPARHSFKVTGSAAIAGPGGMIDCWVVTTDYNMPGHVSTFWFAKGSQLLVRQDSPAGPGKMIVKALID